MEESRETVRGWVRDRGITMDVLLDMTGDVNGAWNVTHSPMVFLIGRDGQVIARFRSPVEPLSREVLAAIESALSKK